MPFLEQLSWQEAERLLADDPIVLLPLGAQLKEHGLHLPLNNDHLMASALAVRVEARTAVVVLPTIGHHYYPAFVEYPGSVSLSLETSRDLVIQICRAIGRHGPRRFYVLNTGISTRQPLALARDLLAEDGIRFAFTDWCAALRPVEAAVGQQLRGSHADEIETSIMLCLAPEVVRMERAAPDVHPDRGHGGLTRNPDGPGVFSPTGAWGDPTLATRAKGLLLVEALVNHIVEDIEALAGPA